MTSETTEEIVSKTPDYNKFTKKECIEEADKLLNEFIDQYSNSNLANIARIYAFRGNIEKSFEWLNKAFEHPDSTLIHVINFPDFKKMHDDPRWNQLVIKMKFPPSHWLVKNLP